MIGVGTTVESCSEGERLDSTPNITRAAQEFYLRSFPGGTSGKEPACQCRRCKETKIRSLGQEDPLEEGVAIHSSVIASKIPGTEGTWWATVYGITKSEVTQVK